MQPPQGSRDPSRQSSTQFSEILPQPIAKAWTKPTPEAHRRATANLSHCHTVNQSQSIRLSKRL
jgi:hypothetical protein